MIGYRPWPMAIPKTIKKIKTMKKTYKNPLLTVVTIQPAQFIAMSTLGTTDAIDGNLGHEATFTDWGEEVDLSEWEEKDLFVE